MQDFSGFERVLNLPIGSTDGKSDAKAAPIIIKGIKDNTEQLVKAVNKIDTLQSMAPNDLVKHGISLDVLEQDKADIRERAWKIYNVAEKVLEKFEGDITNLIGPSDRMYTAGAALISSVAGSLDKLYNIVQKIKQEEEFKNIVTIKEDDESKVMAPDDWRRFIEGVSDKDDKTINATDAEIIE